MKRIVGRSEFPEGLYYSRDHMWAKIEDGLVRIGATDMAQQAAGSLMYVRIMPKGKQIESGRPLGTIETSKWVGPLKSPLSGTVVEVNAVLKTRPTLLNEDPYGAGWLITLDPSRLGEEMKSLMSDLVQIQEFARTEQPKLFK